MENNKLASLLEEIGFKNIQALIYCNLLTNPNLSGYAVALKVGYTKSQVYIALEDMCNKGYIVETSQKPKTFCVVAIEKILQRKSFDDNRVVNETTKLLEELPLMKTGLDTLTHINNFGDATKKLIDMIDNAKSKISIFLSTDVYNILQTNLQAAVERNVILNLITTGTEKHMCDFATEFFHYGAEQSLQLQSGKEWLWIIVDNKSSAFGLFNTGLVETFKTDVVFTENEPFALVINDLIVNLFAYRDYTQKFAGADYLEVGNNARFTL